MTMQADGPTMTRVREQLREIGYPKDHVVMAVFARLCHEIDQLREAMIRVTGEIQNQLDDHADPDQVGPHYQGNEP